MLTEILFWALYGGPSMICCLFYTINYGKTERTTIYHMIRADLSVKRSKFMVWLITFVAILITAMTPVLNLVTAISIIVYTFRGIQKKRKTTLHVPPPPEEIVKMKVSDCYYTCAEYSDSCQYCDGKTHYRPLKEGELNRVEKRLERHRAYFEQERKEIKRPRDSL